MVGARRLRIATSFRLAIDGFVRWNTRFMHARRRVRVPSRQTGNLESLGLSRIFARTHSVVLGFAACFPWFSLDSLVRIVTFQRVTDVQR